LFTPEKSILTALAIVLQTIENKTRPGLAQQLSAFPYFSQ
jgi:hypothetical protein